MGIVKSIVVMIIAVVIAPNALAATPAQAKASGWVCENGAGLLQVKPGAPAEAQALMQSVNNQRLAAYAQIASKTGASAAQVGTMTGQKLISGAPQFGC